MNRPHVIVISNNPFSDLQNNGKTLTSFFTGWPQHQIAQIFFSNEVPSFSVCQKFYRLTDLEILQAFLKFRYARGNVIQENTSQQFRDYQVRLLGNRIYCWVRDIFQSRSAFAYSIRSLMWAWRRWWSTDLEHWLDDFRPEVIFFQGSNCTFAYDIAEYICRRYKIPLVIELTDDYVTSRFSLNPFYWIEMARLQKRFSQTVKQAKNVITIGDAMEDEYRRRFGGQYSVAMNSVDIKKNADCTRRSGETIFEKNLVYVGNLGLNRWKVLVKIGKALARLNQDQPTKFNLDIYSLVCPKQTVLRQFANGTTIRFKGSLNAEQMRTVIDGAYAILHVESFDKKNIAITRLSISTKIPECMAAGKILIAVGSKKVASIRYIKENQIGYVIDDLNPINLDQELKQALAENTENEQRIDNALKLVAERHDALKTRAMILQIIQDATDAKK